MYRPPIIPAGYESYGYPYRPSAGKSTAVCFKKEKKGLHIHSTILHAVSGSKKDTEDVQRQAQDHKDSNSSKCPNSGGFHALCLLKNSMAGSSDSDKRKPASNIHQ